MYTCMYFICAYVTPISKTACSTPFTPAQDVVSGKPPSPPAAQLHAESGLTEVMDHAQGSLVYVSTVEGSDCSNDLSLERFYGRLLDSE